ncbi:MAG: hypothetical protein GX421_07050 [Caldisericales bacterium]|nr:hypothetical protein [Caldisericales bacterium]
MSRAGADRLRKRPFLSGSIIVAVVVVIEAMLLNVLPGMMAEFVPNDLRWTEFPTAFITLVNASLAFLFSYQAFNTFDPGDYKRKIWRFVMLSMGAWVIGHFLSVAVRFGFMVDMARPPNIADYLGYLWMLPLLLVALSRQYGLVRTNSPPNRLMKLGLFVVLLLFAGTILLVSPFFSPRFITLPERLVSLWYIGFSFAIMVVAVSLLSEIYSGLVSVSWKFIIMAVFFFCLSFTLFYFIGTNNLDRGSHFAKTLQAILSQTGTILIGTASFIESRLFG